jgi:hypothetical protein
VDRAAQAGYRRCVLRGLACVIALAACAPSVGGVVEQQRALDRDDAAALSAQLAALPGAVRASVTLHRAVHDPLDHRDAGASAAVLVVVDDRADRAAVTEAARRLVRGTAPDIPEPAIAIELGAVRPELARVGPFEVEASSKGPLRATLAALLVAVLALAGWIALRERRGQGT